MDSERIGQGYVWIAAGNTNQAIMARNDRGLPRWRWVLNADSLRGVHCPEVLIVGTFWDRQDAQEIYGECLACDAMITDETGNAEPYRAEYLTKICAELVNDLSELA